MTTNEKLVVVCVLTGVELRAATAAEVAVWVAAGRYVAGCRIGTPGVRISATETVTYAASGEAQVDQGGWAWL